VSIEWVNRAIDDLRAWGSARAVDVNIDEVRLLCDYASDYLEVSELGGFRPGTFEELLLSIYPRKVIAPPESAPETLTAARTLVDFLLATGAVAEEAGAEMRAVLDRVEPELPVALADTSRFGMAKSIFSAIGPEALEQPVVIPAGDVPVAHPADEEECGCPGCSPLPAVRLEPPERLGAAVREVPLLADAHRLVAWMLEGARRPTVKGRLRARDAAALAGLGLPEPALLWGLARYTGLVEVRDGAAAPGERFGPLAAYGDDDALELWAGTVEFLVENETAGAVTGDAVLDAELYTLCDMLYRLQVPVPDHMVAELLAELGLGEEPDTSETGGPDLARALDRLVYCGLLRVSGEHVGLTPQAVFGLRELYTGMGMDAPLGADLAEGDAGTLIEGLLSGLPTELAEQDIERWLARRAPAQAAAELLAAASGASAVERGIAVTIVDRLGAEAEAAVRARLDDAELRPHAIHWLTARELTAPPLSQQELLWVSIDMLALALPAAEDDPEGFAENMAASGPPAQMIEEMWRVDHPDVVPVLELLGRSLPDGKVAKAARKAAFKARSRSLG
jgi:hypothetical protein